MGWGENDARGPCPLWSGIAVALAGPSWLASALLLCTPRSKPCPLLASQGSCSIAGWQHLWAGPDSHCNCGRRDSVISLPLSCHFLTKGIIRRRKASIPQIPSPWLNHRLRAELEGHVDVCSGVQLAWADGIGGNRPDPQ